MFLFQQEELAVPQKKVKRINKQHKKVSAKQEKHVSTIKTSHGVSRTTIKTDNLSEKRVNRADNKWNKY